MEDQDAGTRLRQVMPGRAERLVKEKVYIETSIVSLLTARPSRDLVVAAMQETTREWWETSRSEFDCLGYAMPTICTPQALLEGEPS